MIKSRIEKIRNELGIGEALLITSQANRFYLTGFHSSAGQVFITADSGAYAVEFSLTQSLAHYIHKLILYSSLLEVPFSLFCIEAF